MKFKIKVIAVLLFYLTAGELLAQPSVLSSQLERVSDHWRSEPITEDLYWHTYRGDDYFESNQSINVLELMVDHAAVSLRLAWSDSALIKTSRFAEEYGAVAAVNGSFFNTLRGGSVVFLKVNGEILTRGAAPRRRYAENGGLAIDDIGQPQILARPRQGWAQSAVSTILGAGPLLLLDSQAQHLNNDSFNRNRHPRTAVGITADHRLLLVTVDGRAREARGMSTPELRSLMRTLGAVSALNLDGGGSTTMWISNRGENGIVNYPSDSLPFNRHGEREVANALLLVPEN